MSTKQTPSWQSLTVYSLSTNQGQFEVQKKVLAELLRWNYYLTSPLIRFGSFPTPAAAAVIHRNFSKFNSGSRNFSSRLLRSDSRAWKWFWKSKRCDNSSGDNNGDCDSHNDAYQNNDDYGGVWRRMITTRPQNVKYWNLEHLKEWYLKISYIFCKISFYKISLHML